MPDVFVASIDDGPLTAFLVVADEVGLGGELLRCGDLVAMSLVERAREAVAEAVRVGDVVALPGNRGVIRVLFDLLSWRAVRLMSDAELVAAARARGLF